jgi:hypothetical protein
MTDTPPADNFLGKPIIRLHKHGYAIARVELTDA